MSTELIVFLLAVLFVCLLVATTIASFGASIPFGSPYVGTSKAKARTMLRLAGVRPGETVVDLGSGMGTIVCVAAKEFGAKGIGYDINPILIFISRVKAFFSGVRRNVHFRRANIFRVPLPQADVVTLYLLPGTLNRLRAKLVAELPPEARVVSRGFVFEGIDDKIQQKAPKTNEFHLYIVKILL